MQVRLTHLQGGRPWRALGGRWKCKCVERMQLWIAWNAGKAYAFAGWEALEGAGRPVEVQMRRDMQVAGEEISPRASLGRNDREGLNRRRTVFSEAAFF